MKLDFNKGDGLIPTIIQNKYTQQVLMLGYMNEKSLEKTRKEKRVTFYSRSKKRLWTKGEVSGHTLHVEEIFADCDQDTLLIMVSQRGPTCHTGSNSCFNTSDTKGFLYALEKVIDTHIATDVQDSYTNQLHKAGINKIAQKVGEEAVELVIEAKDTNDRLFLNEAADLLYHLLVLLHYKKYTLENVEAVLKERANRLSSKK